MSKINVGIYDPDKSDCALIQLALQYCFIDQCNIEFIYDAITLVVNKLDLVFVDIDNEIGIPIVNQMRSKGYIHDIILYTKSKSFMFSSFLVHPFDYLLKPLTHEKLVKTLNDYRLLKKSNNKTISLRDSRGHPKYVIPIAHIEYIESSNTKLFFHLNNGYTLQVYEKLSSIEDEINDRRFLRCHQSYLINMDYVKNVYDIFEMSSKALVPIRVRDKKKIRDLYYQYLLIK